MNTQDQLTEFNNGGSHEQNPNGGIPQGNGNLVEQGETKLNPNDYIFSDRIKVPGKKRTFAEESKRIKKKYESRPNDKPSKIAMKRELNSLMQEQEFERQKLTTQANNIMQKAYGGDIKDDTKNEKIQKKRYNALYGDIENKIFNNLPDASKLPESNKRIIQGSAINKFDLSKENLPPLDETLKEIQNKIKNMSNEEINKLMTFDYSKSSLMDAYKVLPKNISLTEAITYINHLKNLKNQGYTFKDGGKLYNQGGDKIKIDQGGDKKTTGQNSKWVNPLDAYYKNPYSSLNLIKKTNYDQSGKPILPQLPVLRDLTTGEDLNGVTGNMNTQGQDSILYSTSTPLAGGHIDKSNNYNETRQQREQAQKAIPGGKITGGKEISEIEMKNYTGTPNEGTSNVAQYRQPKTYNEHEISITPSKYQSRTPEDIKKLNLQPYIYIKHPGRTLKDGTYQEPYTSKIKNLEYWNFGKDNSKNLTYPEYSELIDKTGGNKRYLNAMSGNTDIGRMDIAHNENLPSPHYGPNLPTMDAAGYPAIRDYQRGYDLGGTMQYAQMGMNTIQNIDSTNQQLNNSNLTEEQQSNIKAQSANQTVNSAISAIPVYGQIYSVAKGASDTVRNQLGEVDPETGEKTYKTSIGHALDAYLKPQHEYIVDAASKGKWGDAALSIIPFVPQMRETFGKAYGGELSNEKPFGPTGIFSAYGGDINKNYGGDINKNSMMSSMVIPGSGIGAGITGLVNAVKAYRGNNSEINSNAITQDSINPITNNIENQQTLPINNNTLPINNTVQKTNKMGLSPTNAFNNNVFSTSAMGGGLSRSKDYGSKKKPYPSVSSSNFAGSNRSYPIPTKADAIDALRLAGLHGRSDVRAKVFKKYPSLKKAYGGDLRQYDGVSNPEIPNTLYSKSYSANVNQGVQDMPYQIPYQVAPPNSQFNFNNYLSSTIPNSNQSTIPVNNQNDYTQYQDNSNQRTDQTDNSNQTETDGQGNPYQTKVDPWGLAVSNVGNIYDIAQGMKKPDVTNYERINPSYVNYLRQMENAVRNVNDVYSSMVNAVKQNASSAGNYLSNRAALAARQAGQVGNITSRMGEQEANVNAQIENRANAQNAQIAMNEAIANEQNKAAKQSLVSQGLHGVGTQTGQYLSDVNKNNAQNQILQGMNGMYYKIVADENGNPMVVPIKQN